MSSYLIKPIVAASVKLAVTKMCRIQFVAISWQDIILKFTSESHRAEHYKQNIIFICSYIFVCNVQQLREELSQV